MPSEFIQKAVSFVRGEDDFMYKQVPPQLGNAHITELLGRHPFHPYNPTLPAGHPCQQLNELFFRCMSDRAADEALHMKHVNCYHPYKTDLMKCNATQVREAKRRAAEAGVNVAQLPAEEKMTEPRAYTPT
jgi:hypothetical protein